jgi:hypothetical protein
MQGSSPVHPDFAFLQLSHACAVLPFLKAVEVDSALFGGLSAGIATFPGGGAGVVMPEEACGSTADPMELKAPAGDWSDSGERL